MYGGGRWNGGRDRKGVCGCCGVTDVDAEGCVSDNIGGCGGGDDDVGCGW